MAKRRAKQANEQATADELVERIATRLKQLVQAPPDDLLRDIQALADLAADARSHDDRDEQNSEPLRGYDTAAERENAGAHLDRKQYGRHDKPTVPAGYVIHEGKLVMTKHASPPEASPESVWHVTFLRRVLEGLTKAGAQEEPGDALARHADWLRSAYEAFLLANGLARETKRSGSVELELREPWETQLERMLWEDAKARATYDLAREQVTLEIEDAASRGLIKRGRVQEAIEQALESHDGRKTGESIVEALRQNSAPPDELTGEAVDGMRRSIRLNARGAGAKATPQTAVELLARKLNRKGMKLSDIPGDHEAQVVLLLYADLATKSRIGESRLYRMSRKKPKKPAR